MYLLEERIVTILRRFDHGDKLKLARELAEILEWQGDGTLHEIVQSALGRDLKKDELARIRILELALKDKGLIAPEFPDGYGSPKAGR
jgi:hypothetical protein